MRPVAYLLIFYSKLEGRRRGVGFIPVLPSCCRTKLQCLVLGMDFTAFLTSRTTRLSKQMTNCSFSGFFARWPGKSRSLNTKSSLALFFGKVKVRQTKWLKKDQQSFCCIFYRIVSYFRSLSRGIARRFEFQSLLKMREIDFVRENHHHPVRGRGSLLQRKGILERQLRSCQLCGRKRFWSSRSSCFRHARNKPHLNWNSSLISTQS